MKIKRIQFDEVLAPVDCSNAEIIWKVDTSLFGKELKIYKKDSHTKDDVIKNLLTHYNFNSGKNLFVGNTIKQGDLTLSRKSTNRIELTLKPSTEIVYLSIKETQMQEIALKELAKIVSDPSQFKLMRTSEITQGDENNIEMKSLIYYKMIDGYETIGNSSIHFQFRGDGLSKIIISYSDLGESFSVKTVPFDKVKKLIDHGDYCIYIKNELTTAVKELIVEKVDITYLDRVDSATEKHIQPCYRLTGSLITDNLVSEFTIFIRAVPDEYTYE
jgi:hypothetical protein